MFRFEFPATEESILARISLEEGGVSLDELTLASLLVQAPRKTLMLLVADAGESAGTVVGLLGHSLCV